MLRKQARVLGPYPNAGRFRLVLLEGGRRKSLVLPTQAEAEHVKAQLGRMLVTAPSRSTGAALAEYLADKQARGAAEPTLRTLRYRLGQFLPADEPLGALGPERAQRMYQEETARCGRAGRPVAAATHRALLRAVKSFFTWAAARGYVPESPFARVRPVGTVRTGKTQLRIDEARRLCAVLSAHAAADPGAVAVLLQLLLGLRTGEVLARRVRDVDDGGRVLWITAGKTANARRRLLVPAPLQPILRALTAGHPPDALLIGAGAGRTRPYAADYLWHRVHRYCDLAGVPRVCPHSLRGLHATLAISAGSTSHAVASALGHSSFAITARHYADPSALAAARVRTVADALGAGPPASPETSPKTSPDASPDASAEDAPIETLQGFVARLSPAQQAELRRLLAKP